MQLIHFFNFWKGINWQDKSISERMTDLVYKKLLILHWGKTLDLILPIQEPEQLKLSIKKVVPNSWSKYETILVIYNKGREPVLIQVLIMQISQRMLKNYMMNLNLLSLFDIFISLFSDIRELRLIKSVWKNMIFIGEI